MGAWINFKSAKKLCTMEQLLSRYNVKLREFGDDLRGKCPLPTHSSAELASSFSVSRSKNIWSCRSDSCIDNSGRKGGNVLDFIAVMEQCSLPDAANKFVDWFGNTLPSPAGKEKAPRLGKGPDAPHESLSQGASSNRTTPAGNGKGYMKQIDRWFDKTIRRGDQEEDEEKYYHRIRSAIKSRLMDSFKAGKAAASAQLTPAAHS